LIFLISCVIINYETGGNTMSYVVDVFPNQVEIRENVRTQDGENYPELVQSMQDQGQLVPIQVYQDDVTNRFVLMFGHQRLKAAKELEWRTIRATVVPSPVDEADALVQQTMENEARSGMSYLEKARVFDALLSNGMRATKVAEKFGVTKSTVSIALATLNADPKLQKAIEDGKISPSGVEPIIFQDAETQALLADAVIAAKSVRRVKAVVNTYKRAGVIPGVDVEETTFEEDPLLILYRDQLAEDLHILNNIHPAWLDDADNFCQEDDFLAVNNQWERILEECDSE